VSPGPSASAGPSGSSAPGASSAPSPSSASGAARPDAQHGVITRGGSGGVLRTEASAAAVTTLNAYGALAVSKDGRRVAYVLRGETAEQLRVFDTANPGSQKTVLDVTSAGQSLGGIVWSSDGNDELLV